MSDRLVQHADTVPLSGGQLFIWDLLQRSGDMTRPWTLPDIWLIPEKASYADVKRAFDVLVSRHEVLRTYYGGGTNRDDLRQIIYADIEYDIDLHHVKDDDWEAQADAVLDEYVRMRIDITEKLSWKVALILSRGKPKCLVFAGHHIAVDPFALSILKSEFTKLLNGCDPAELGKALQPRELAEMERSDTWKKRLGMATDHRIRTLEKVLETVRKEDGSFEPLAGETNGEVAPDAGILVTDVTEHRLKTIASQYNVTPASLIFSLWTISLSKLINVSFIPFQFIVSNRTTHEMRTLVCSMAASSLATVEVPTDAQFSKFTRAIHWQSINEQRYALNYPTAKMREEITKVISERIKLEDLTLPACGYFQYQPRAAETKIQKNSDQRKDDRYIDRETRDSIGNLRIKHFSALRACIRYGYLELNLHGRPKICRSLAYAIRKNVDLVGEHSGISVENLQ